MAFSEDTNKRTQKAKHFYDPITGKSRAEFTLHDQHYQDEQGVLQEVVEDLEIDGLDGFAYKAEKARHKIRFGVDGKRRWYPRRNIDEYIELGLPQYWNGSSWQTLTLGTPVREANTITWDRTNFALKLIHTWRKIKLEIILKNSNAAKRVRWPVSLHNLTWDNYNVKSGETVVGSVEPITAQDANGAEIPITNSYSGGYVEFTADLTEAVYPVTIDPTLTDQGTTSKDTSLNSANSDKSYGTENFTGYIVWLLYFDCSSIPTTATLVTNSAVLTVYNNGTKTTNRALEYHELKEANGDWVEGTTQDPATGGQSTWDYKSQTGSGAGTAWAGSAGASTADTDYDSATLGTATYIANDPQGSPTPSTLADSAVQAWISNPSVNYGIRQYSTAVPPDFFASETPTAGYRPKLVVEYTTGSSSIKTVQGLAKASVKTVNGLAIASVKTINGLA